MNQENNSGTSTWIGSCKFCGQIAAVRVSGTKDQTQDEAATSICTCAQAQNFRTLTKELERVASRVDSLFIKCEELGLSPVEENQIAIIESLAGYMVEMEIQGVNLDLGNGIKCKISRNSKGELEISRTDTSTQKMKV